MSLMSLSYSVVYPVNVGESMCRSENVIGSVCEEFSLLCCSSIHGLPCKCFSPLAARAAYFGEGWGVDGWWLILNIFVIVLCQANTASVGTLPPPPPHTHPFLLHLLSTPPSPAELINLPSTSTLHPHHSRLSPYPPPFFKPPHPASVNTHARHLYAITD